MTCRQTLKEDCFTGFPQNKNATPVAEMGQLPKVGLNVIYLALVIYNPGRGDRGHINTTEGGPEGRRGIRMKDRGLW